jgi:microcystin-dependent protein
MKKNTMLYFKTFCVIFCLFLASNSLCQNGVGIGTPTPHTTAILEISSNAKGLLIPRLSNAEISTINSPATGLMVYNTSANAFRFYNGLGWEAVGLPTGSIIMWAGDTAPEGWLLCDGNNGTPNLSGRFVVGYSSGDPDYGLISNKGGVTKVLLGVGDLPPHDHLLNDHSHVVDLLTEATGEHLHSMTLHDSRSGSNFQISNGGNAGPQAMIQGWTRSQQTLNSSAESYIDDANTYTNHGVDTSHPHTSAADVKPIGKHQHRIFGPTGGNPGAKTDVTGGGGTFENRPPYYVLAYIMKK